MGINKKSRGEDRYAGVHIKCIKCQMDNPPDRVFCGTCGAKLPLGGDPFAGFVRRKTFRPGMKTISHLLSLLLLASIVLALWPAAKIGLPGDVGDRNSYLQKVDSLIAATDQNRQAVATFDEEELNAFIAAQVAQLRQSASGGVEVRYAAVSLESDNVRLQLKTKIGPINLTRGLSGKVAVENNQFSFRIEKASLGVLPLPPVLANFVATGFTEFLSGLEPELKVIDSVSRIETVEGRVRLMVN